MASLLAAVVKQKGSWLSRPPSICGVNGWIAGDEGELYARWSSELDRFDLASISIDKEHQGRGLFTKILRAVCSDGRIGTVRIENILVDQFYEGMKKVVIEGRRRVEIDLGFPGAHTLDFVKEKE